MLLFIHDFVLSLPRNIKRFFVLGVDVSLSVFSVWLAYCFRFDEFVFFSGRMYWVAVTSIGIALPIFVAFGFYRNIFRYSNFPVLVIVAKATSLYFLLFASIFTIFGIQGIPRSIGVLQPILLFLLVASSRICIGSMLSHLQRGTINLGFNKSRALIYGAGKAGQSLASYSHNDHQLLIAGFLDDDPLLWGQLINGCPVYNPQDLHALVGKLQIDIVLLAMPLISRNRRNQILANVRLARVAVRSLPSMMDLALGRAELTDIGELSVDDLLGRDSVTPCETLLANCVSQKVVLVTGAGGSIGGELCRQILRLSPKTLVLIEQSEFALYSIYQELCDGAKGLGLSVTPTIVPLLASVQDRPRMKQIISTWQPNTIYHAAAYKHVSLVETNLIEGIKNNVFGTLCVAEIAKEAGVSSFVLISTDKAVRPTSVMGASKRIAEQILQSFSEDDCVTQFSMVRFGNVLGSSGSVVPKFRQQIHNGGPLTITHPDVTRYFMTIPEAAQLVIQASTMAIGGDVFVLDMGSPVRIIDLARRMIELAGLTVCDAYNPEGDIKLSIIGLRPGEKLYEELLIGDGARKTAHPRIMTATEDFMILDLLRVELDALKNAVDSNDIDSALSAIKKIVPNYHINENILG